MFHGVPLIEATTPYRMIKMDMKKIMALAMMVLMALPSLTIVGAVDGVGPADAIERAQIYLDKVRTLADNMADEYQGNVMMQGYLIQLYALLGQDWEEDPEILFQLDKDGEATAELSEVISHSETHSAHLKTTGDVGDGDEARIVIPMPEGFTLGDLNTLSWWEYLVNGYPPHIDVILDLDGNTVYDDGTFDDALVFEYAYNYESHAAETWPTYDALTGAWYRTFSDDAQGPAVIDNETMAWATKGAPGPLDLEFGEDNFFYLNLADWKEGVTYTAEGYNEKTINSDSIVLRLEIEVDNYIVQTEAYVDDIKINTDIYDFEEEEQEGWGAEGFLDQASASLVEGDIKSAARSLASARNILGRINGLLKSMAKAHKMARAERFERKFERRIQGIRDKIERPKGPKPK